MSDVVIRCDASPRVGLGHLTRSIAIAQAFHDDCGLRASLLMRYDPAALTIAREAGVPVTIVPRAGAKADAVVQRELTDARAFVLDYREELNAEILSRASGHGVVIATIDDPTPRRLIADLVFYPPIPQLSEWDWTGKRGDILTGWEWVVLRRDLGSPRVDRTSNEPRLLISLGGSDPHDLSSMVIEALSGIAQAHRPTLVIGPENPHREAVRARTVAAKVEVFESPPNFTELIHDTDIAVISFGVTAYELAACRVPALHMCLTDDHARSARVFQEAGVARIVGTHPAITVARIRQCLNEALTAHRSHGSWMHTLPTLLDTAGAARIARRIASKMRRS